jgi:hypothetical protein
LDAAALGGTAREQDNCEVKTTGQGLWAGQLVAAGWFDWREVFSPKPQAAPRKAPGR